MLIRVALILAVVNLSACSYFTKRRTPTQETQVMLQDDKGHTKEAPAEASTNGPKELTPIKPDDKEGAAQAEEMKNAVAEAAEHISKTHGKVAREAGPVPAEKAMGWLRNGNTRYTKGFFRKDGATAKDRMRLAQEQHPHSVIISCSDSRVPPEVVFDQKLGEVFVVRTFGESMNTNSIASVEYAVNTLGANLIVVLGHDSCMGIKAALDSLNGGDLGSPALNSLVQDLKPRLAKFKGISPSPGLLEESWANVDGIAKDLLLRSEIVRDAVTSGEVKIVRAMYHLDAGNVDFR